ncbi:arginine pathway regulatory protein ArgR [Acetivibrio straminisolvens JCM 21531]|uniref:Arginine pathway regulatory protein ArgR n=2 Tax=Acetivibrio straminisolvens TaxID=253314 RepID=W4V4K1_9FIRM|nr:arginine pathway regulatory protein ArgR [Acetivibrio straminisolvens JCM 21531]
MNNTEIVGSIAGDDTVLIVCRTEKIAKEFVEKLSKLVKSDDR